MRNKIYENLLKKAYYEQIKLTTYYNHKEVLISEYIDRVKQPKFQGGEVEISETSIYNNCNIVIYYLNDYINDTDVKLTFYNIYGNLNASNIKFIFIALIGNFHYQLIDQNIIVQSIFNK